MAQKSLHRELWGDGQEADVKQSPWSDLDGVFQAVGTARTMAKRWEACVGTCK